MMQLLGEAICSLYNILIKLSRYNAVASDSCNICYYGRDIRFKVLVNIDLFAAKVIKISELKLAK